MREIFSKNWPKYFQKQFLSQSCASYFSKLWQTGLALISPKKSPHKRTEGILVFLHFFFPPIFFLFASNYTFARLSSFCGVSPWCKQPWTSLSGNSSSLSLYYFSLFLCENLHWSWWRRWTSWFRDYNFWVLFFFFITICECAYASFRIYYDFFINRIIITLFWVFLIF